MEVAAPTVTRITTHGPTFRRIAVVLGDGPSWHRVTAIAVSLAAATGAEVLLVHVDRNVVPCMGPSAAESGLQHGGRATVDAAMDAFSEAGVKCRSEQWRTARGDILGTILQATDEFDADVIVAGGDGDGRRRRILARSLGQRIASRSRRPLLLVP